MSLISQHEEELQEINNKLAEEQPPRIKYSTQVLNMRNNLKNLIKARSYKEAETVKSNLEKKEEE